MFGRSIRGSLGSSLLVAALLGLANGVGEKFPVERGEALVDRNSGRKGRPGKPGRPHSSRRKPVEPMQRTRAGGRMQINGVKKFRNRKSRQG